MKTFKVQVQIFKLFSVLLLHNIEKLQESNLYLKIILNLTSYQMLLKSSTSTLSCPMLIEIALF